jgi:hypothetical protein
MIITTKRKIDQIDLFKCKQILYLNLILLKIHKCTKPINLNLY